MITGNKKHLKNLIKLKLDPTCIGFEEFYFSKNLSVIHGKILFKEVTTM
jgi:hypothetical protein